MKKTQGYLMAEKIIQRATKKTLTGPEVARAFLKRGKEQNIEPGPGPGEKSINSMFLYLDNGETIFLNGKDPDNLVGLTATDVHGQPLKQGRYTLADLRLIIIGKNGVIETCVYDPQVRLVRRS